MLLCDQINAALLSRRDLFKKIQKFEMWAVIC